MSTSAYIKYLTCYAHASTVEIGRCTLFALTTITHCPAMFKIIFAVAILCGARCTLEAPATGSLQLRLLAEESGQFVAGLRGGRVHAHAARPSKQM